MPDCPICDRAAVACLRHGEAKALRTPEFYSHVAHGRVYLHAMEWSQSAPEDLKV